MTTIDYSCSICYLYMFLACLLALAYIIANWLRIESINLSNHPSAALEEERIFLKEEDYQSIQTAAHIIEKGIWTFISIEMCFIFIYLVLFCVIVFLVDNYNIYTAVAFVVGIGTSLLSSLIGIAIATRTNLKVALTSALFEENTAYNKAFRLASNGGIIIGFSAVTLSLISFGLLLMVYLNIVAPTTQQEYEILFESLCGFGLGASSVSLFFRVGGSIFSKSANVTSELVGKIGLGFSEDESSANPASIANLVGTNVGDILGMGSDLFGSLCQAFVSCVYLSASSVGLLRVAYFTYPLMICSTGLMVCLITSIIFTFCIKVEAKKKIESNLKFQVLISCIILTPCIMIQTLLYLPDVIIFGNPEPKITTNWKIGICCLCGLWCGMIILAFTEYFTSNKLDPTKSIAYSCKYGGSVCVIYGLALGYLSCLIPSLAIGFTILIANQISGLYGIAISSLGMISCLPIRFSIEGFSPIAANARGIMTLSLVGGNGREITEDLSNAGVSSSSIGKGCQVGVACLVACGTFCAFDIRMKVEEINLVDPSLCCVLIIGTMVPYLFSALTMNSVNHSSTEMCGLIREQVKSGLHNYKGVITYLAYYSIYQLLYPGLLILLPPILIGRFFGSIKLSAYLIGIILSSLQMATSASTSASSWMNAKKFIEDKQMQITKEDKILFKNLVGVYYEKKSYPHKAAVTGERIGDFMKETSMPSLNALITLSAMTSLIFARVFYSD